MKKGKVTHMKKRIFVLVTALMLVLGLAVTAGADEPVALRQADINSSASTFWQTGNQYHLVAGSYKLMEDIELAQALTIDAASYSVEIDLNGYTLSLKSGVQDSVICVTGGVTDGVTVSGTLFLEDNSAAGTGKITGGTGYKENDASSGVGGGIRLLDGGTVSLNGGTITGCKADLGGGIYAKSGFVYMHGGTITGCTATTSGGGIYVEDGLLDMYEGTVSGCTAVNGGAVYLTADQLTTIYSDGGTVSGTVYVGEQCTVTPSTTKVKSHKFDQQTVFDGAVTVNGAIGGGVYRGQVSRTDTGFLANGIFWHDRNGILQVDGNFSSVAGMYGTTPYLVDYNYDTDTLYKRCTVLVARFDNSPSEDDAAQTRASVTDDRSDDQDIYLAAPDAPTRAGYTFLGWYTAPVGGTKWDFDADALSQNQLAEGVTLYAQWESDHQHTRRQNTAAVTPEAPAADADTVTSAKTFDAGVAVYGAMAVSALLGMGYVGKKRV